MSQLFQEGSAIFSVQAIYLSALLRRADGKLLILASNCKQADPVVVYGLRWGIEHLFQCLKGRGFNMEDTRSLTIIGLRK